MEEFSTLSDIVNLWPSRQALAAEMTAFCPLQPVSKHQAHKWAEKGSMPSKYHQQFLRACQARNFDVSAEMIIRLHAPLGEAA